MYVTIIFFVVVVENLHFDFQTFPHCRFDLLRKWRYCGDRFGSSTIHSVARSTYCVHCSVLQT